jgi:acyl-coenzyme A thioesterase 13
MAGFWKSERKRWFWEGCSEDLKLYFPIYHKSIMRKDFVELLQKGIGKNVAEHAMGLTKWLNGRIESVTDDGLICLSFDVREDMLNPLGMLHGGATSAILDEVMGLQLYAINTEGAFVSISINIDFLNKALFEERLYAKPTVLRLGKTTAHCVCDLVNEQGKLIAKSSSNFVRIA